jgi:hypothetical protein
MKTTILVTTTLFVTLVLGCLPEGKERCHGKYVWNSKALNCDLKTSSNTKNDASQDTPAVEDDAEVSEGGESELTSGLGKECKANSECAAYKEDLCTANRFVPIGYCTVGKCTEAAHPCPSGYSCCASTDSTIPDACLTTDEYGTVKTMGFCK